MEQRFLKLSDSIAYDLEVLLESNNAFDTENYALLNQIMDEMLMWIDLKERLEIFSREK